LEKDSLRFERLKEVIDKTGMYDCPRFDPKQDNCRHHSLAVDKDRIFQARNRDARRNVVDHRLLLRRLSHQAFILASHKVRFVSAASQIANILFVALVRVF
jgi:hypothetical protein